MKCLLIVLFLFIAKSETKLPDNFQKCSAKGNYNECLKSAIPDAIKKMANGIPEVGAPPLDPLVVPSITVEGAVIQTYNNMKIYNVTSAKFENVNATISSESFVAEMTLFIPEVYIIADYNFKGRVLLLDIDGKGNSTTIFKNVKMSSDLIAEAFKEGGKSFYKLKTFQFAIDPEKAVFEFENIITGNKQLSEEINKSINENWKPIFAELKPSYEEALGQVFKAYANNIFSRLEIEELYQE